MSPLLFFVMSVGALFGGVRGAIIAGVLLCASMLFGMFFVAYKIQVEAEANPRNDSVQGTLVCERVWMDGRYQNILVDHQNSMLSRAYIRNGEHVPC
jgi:hypothetical protein